MTTHAQVLITHPLFSPLAAHSSFTLTCDAALLPFLTPLWDDRIKTFFSCQNVHDIRDHATHEWVCSRCEPPCGYLVIAPRDLDRTIALLTRTLDNVHPADWYSPETPYHLLHFNALDPTPHLTALQPHSSPLT